MLLSSITVDTDGQDTFALPASVLDALQKNPGHVPHIEITGGAVAYKWVSDDHTAVTLRRIPNEGDSVLFWTMPKEQRNHILRVCGQDKFIEHIGD
jgi:hypothetical protein